MAASYNFRNALNGFNREDVVHYIEYINTKNTALVNQLRADLAAAQQEVASLKEKPPKNQELEAKIMQLSAEVARLQDEVLNAQTAKSNVETALADMTRQRDEALAAKTANTQNTEAELEAYRRAERVERQAKERTDVMFAKANGIVSEASGKVDVASRQLDGIANQVSEQLSILQLAVSDSKRALQDAAKSLSELKP